MSIANCSEWPGSDVGWPGKLVIYDCFFIVWPPRRAVALRVLGNNYGWNPIETASMDEDVTLEVTDGRGPPYRLSNPCRRTASGWVIREVSASCADPSAMPRLRLRYYVHSYIRAVVIAVQKASSLPKCLRRNFLICDIRRSCKGQHRALTILPCADGPLPPCEQATGAERIASLCHG
jgi:hypothetical protein